MFKRLSAKGIKRQKVKDSFLDDGELDKHFFRSTSQEAEEEIARLLACKNHFEVLELNPEADFERSEESARNSYMQKCELINPNFCPHPKAFEAFTKLAKAYDTLTDPTQYMNHQIFVNPPQVDPLLQLLQGMLATPNVERALPTTRRVVAVRAPQPRADAAEGPRLRQLMEGGDGLLQLLRGLEMPGRDEEPAEAADRRVRRRTSAEGPVALTPPVAASVGSGGSSDDDDDMLDPLNLVMRALQGDDMILARGAPARAPTGRALVRQGSHGPFPAFRMVGRRGSDDRREPPNPLRLLFGGGREGDPVQMRSGPPQRTLAEDMRTLREMGFTDDDRNRNALIAAGGNLAEAVEALTSM